MKILGASIVLAIAFPSFSVAASSTPCVTKVCVQVVTDPSTNQIVITAVHNKPGVTSSPRPSVLQTPRPPRTPRPVSPRPRATHVASKKPLITHPHVYRKPKPKSAVSLKPKVTNAVSLSDRLTQLLPQRNIFFVPKSGAVVQVPMYFWTDATPQFSTTSMILGINVGVTLTPLFTWNFGDGTLFTTTSPGAPYPDTTISHIYRSAGTYKVSLTISWSGTWSAENNSYPVLGGNIVQSYSSTFVVSSAPTKFVK